jgi:RNA recognition motif-containing protein
MAAVGPGSAGNQPGRAKMNIQIGNLSEEVVEEDLRKMFGILGRVRSTTIVRDRRTEKPKGFAVVEMPSSDEAGKAMASLNGRLLKGPEVVVSRSHPQHH